MKTLNYSRQREAIYNYLLSTKKHPTAETIFQAVQQDYPKISLATVYRNLTVLEETGQVQRIPCNDAKDHYDANTAEHPHFVCNYQGFGGTIEQSQVVFFGKCPACLDKEKNNNNS